MTCTYSPEAYVFGSEENHALLEAETNELLHFGHNFPARRVAPTGWTIPAIRI